MRNVKSLLMGFVAVGALHAQTVRLQSAPLAEFPAVVDSNSPAYRADGHLYLYNSMDLPIRSETDDLIHFGKARAVFVHGTNTFRWIEAVWRDEDGTVFAWYHAEPSNVCPNQPLTMPEIGALRSPDGINFEDLGIVLRSGDEPACDAKNAYFAGGHGDFSVILDRAGRNFYFLFTNYGGPVESQGIALARMAIDYRAYPVGQVWKFYQGDWTEPGIAGKVTPVIPASGSWLSGTPDSFWGPAVHWNTALQQYVVLMNRAIDSIWTQEGIYIAFNPDLSNPGGWTKPLKLTDSNGWYPQVLGYGPQDTDTNVGSQAKLFVMGTSTWDLIFEPARAGDSVSPEPSASTRDRALGPSRFANRKQIPFVKR